jgi:hypothetical protein
MSKIREKSYYSMVELLDMENKIKKYEGINMTNILNERILKRYYRKLCDNNECDECVDGHTCNRYCCLAWDNARRASRWRKLLEREKLELLRTAYNYLGEVYPVNNYFITLSPLSLSAKGNKYKRDIAFLLRDTLEEYGKQMRRWVKIEGVLEFGVNGDHPHLHAILYTNPDQEKSVKAHITKGNITSQIRKVWKSKCKTNTTSKMLDSKHAIKYNFVIPAYLQEKQDYMKEELKQEGHQNPFDHEILSPNEKNFSFSYL